MTHLVIGRGEVGRALLSIFNCGGIDRNEEFLLDGQSFDIIHICIPYSAKFDEIVRGYQKQFSPLHTVIHSTVPVGTSTRLKAIHSPVLGIHPHLEEGIRTFTKFLGGEYASEVADEFRRNGLKVYVYDKAETCELMKILDTTFYGLCIEYTKDVKLQCQKYNVPFEAWTLHTNNYNEGYVKLGHPEYQRPNLVPIMTDIKGHCVMPNLELIDTKFTKFLKDNA